jgi:hypothetical protein
MSICKRCAYLAHYFTRRGFVCRCPDNETTCLIFGIRIFLSQSSFDDIG